MAVHFFDSVVGVFDDVENAERALEELRRAGFRDEQITIAMSNVAALTAGVPEGIRKGHFEEFIADLFGRRPIEQDEASLDEERRFYESEFQLGRVLLRVEPRERKGEALAILRRFDAYGMDSRGNFFETDSIVDSF